MSLRFVDGFAWSNFTNSTYKYTAGSGFFGGSGGGPTLTGSIDPGPFTNTKGITFKVAAGSADGAGNTGWLQAVDLGSTEDTWIAAMWIMPQNLTSRQSFFAFISHEPPNRLPAMVLHLNAALKLEMNSQNSGAGSVAQPHMNTLVADLVATSNYTFPQGVWTHICIRCQFLNATNGRVQLWVNGSLDTDVSGINIGPTTAVSQAWLVWQNPVSNPAQITMSQIVVCDINGSINNTRVSPSTTITTIFPSSDVANGGWTPASAGSNFSQVDNTNGPSVGSYVTLPSLAFPDELFGIPALSTTDRNIALVANICSVGTGAPTLQALVQQSATKYLLGAPITSPASAALTFQGIAETNPATGAAWKDPDISADAFGFRGITGTGENVEQFFLEKVWISGIGSYSYSK